MREVASPKNLDQMRVAKNSPETLTAKRRKDQVLAAAVECVRREGFHRTSMSQISAAAGMSSGHIYHYFGSKEAIVAGIVEREHNELGQLINDVKDATRSSDPVTAIVDQAPKAAERYMDRDHTALMLEVLAESARNATVANLVQQSDEELRRAFYELLGGSTPEVRSRSEIASALFEGLSIRGLRNPELSKTLDQDMLQRVLRFLLTC